MKEWCRSVSLMRSAQPLIMWSIFSPISVLFSQEVRLIDAPGPRYREMAQTFQATSIRLVKEDSIFSLQNVQKLGLQQVFQTNTSIILNPDRIVLPEKALSK